jgi:signal peptidase II
MTYIFMAVMAVLILVLDQVTKLLTVANIQLFQSIEVIPGIVGLTYVQNDGAAFSMLEGQHWLFAVVFAIFAAFIIWEFPKKRLPLSTFERFCIVAVFAGGLGNMIDRLRLGYVIDMIDTETSIPFIANFPIFNVADIFVTCGCIALMVHIIFFNKEFWKDEKK